MRRLRSFDPTDQPVGERTFQDLLIHQLAEEVTELVARGLHRAYSRRAEWLESPRGQLDFQQMTRQAGGATAALPCIHHPRLSDNLLNRVLLAGLHLGVGLTEDLLLRSRLRRLAQQLALDTPPIPLNMVTLAQAR